MNCKRKDCPRGRETAHMIKTTGPANPNAYMLTHLQTQMPPNLQSHIVQKRAFSEILPDDESRQSKKHRKELEILTSDDKTKAKSSIYKDSKKKRKKKKRRKSPLINPDIDIHSFKQAPKSMITEVPISVASSSTLSDVPLSAPVETGKTLVDYNALHTGLPMTEGSTLNVSIILVSWIILTIWSG